jgi:NTP pyrophosphatase (non-canonical NTP hydrolase)
MSRFTFDALAEAIHEFAVDRDWEKFHSPKNLSMAISIEAAELMENFLWAEPDRSIPPERKEAIAHEMADVLIYLIRLAQVADVNLADAIAQKLALNAEKYPTHKVRGSAKKYSDYSEEKSSK